MTPYIDNTDLAKHVPDINDYSPPSSWADQIQFATDDVLNKIKADWWEQLQGRGTELDESLLNTAALEKLAAYRTLGFYACPYLAKEEDEDGDRWSRLADKYEKRYQEEWDIVKSLPLYDFDEDTEFEDEERQGPIVRKLARG